MASSRSKREFGLFAMKIAALLSACGGPMMLMDRLKPRLGMKLAFSIAFAPIALMGLGSFSISDRSMGRWGQLNVTLGVGGAFILTVMQIYGAWRLMTEAPHGDSPLYLIGVLVGLASVSAYLFAVAWWLRGFPRRPPNP